MVSSHFLTFLCFRLIIVFSFSVFSEPGSGFVKILYFYPLVLCANSSSEQHGKKKLAIEKPFLAHTYSSGLVKWTFTASQLRAAHRIALRCITTFATVSIPFLKQLCLWAILSWAKFIQVHVWICKRKFCYYENSYSTARLTKNHFPIWQFEKMRLFDFFPLWSPHLRCKSSSVLILLCSGHVSLLPFAALASIFQAAIRKTLTIQNRKKIISTECWNRLQHRNLECTSNSTSKLSENGGFFCRRQSARLSMMYCVSECAFELFFSCTQTYFFHNCCSFSAIFPCRWSVVCFDFDSLIFFSCSFSFSFLYIFST